MDIWLVALASCAAGFVDAIVGGGGLILLPTLFAVFPSVPPGTLLGVNKSASIWGTGLAAWRYSQRVRLRWRTWVPAALAGFAGAWLGAWSVTRIPPVFVRQLLPVVLLAVLVHTWLRKDMGRHHLPRYGGRHECVAACVLSTGLGFYDGLFGPGTGSFLIFLFVRWLGYDFLHASAAAKLINLATNLAVLSLFAITGHVWWSHALLLGLCNVVGSLAGTHMALRHGAGFVRAAFLVVVSLLILKTARDSFLLF